MRIKETRSQWFGTRARAGEKPKLKHECPLDKAIKDLKKQEAELEVIEADFHNLSRMMQRSSDLEMLARDLRRKIDESSRICAELQAEYECSSTRIDAHRVAGERVEQAQ